METPKDSRMTGFHTESDVPVHTCSSAALIKQLNELSTVACYEASGEWGEKERERQRREKERERDTTCISVARLRREPAKQWHLECWSTVRSCQSLLHLPTWTRAGSFQNQTSFSFPDALKMTYCRSQQCRTCCCSTGGWSWSPEHFLRVWFSSRTQTG